MKKFFLFLAFLLALFIALNLAYVFLLESVDWNFSKAKEAYGFNAKEFKVLVLGNSTAMDGINSAILSDKIGTTYNFSLGGASLETNFIQLSHYLKSNKPPEKVLLFLSSCHVNYNNIHELNPIVDHYENGMNFSDLSQLPLFKFRWLFIENLKVLISAKHRAARVVGGQLQITKTIADASNLKQNECQDKAYGGDGYQWVGKIAKLAESAGAEIQIFEMPCWTSRQDSCADYMIDGYRVFNLNNRDVCAPLIDPQTDWLSENHLNLSGSEKITNYVSHLLLKQSGRQSNNLVNE